MKKTNRFYKKITLLNAKSTQEDQAFTKVMDETAKITRIFVRYE